MQMNTSKSKLLFAVVSLAFSGLQLAGCEEQKAKPEQDVVFQSSGRFALYDGPELGATLIVRNVNKALTLEIRENKTQEVLATGSLPGAAVKDLFDGVRGPLSSTIESTTITVSQPCTLKREVQNAQFHYAAGAVGLTGPSSNSSPSARQSLVYPSPVVIPIVTGGTLEFVGSRNIQYNTGLLQGMMGGNLRVKFRNASGEVAGRFTGEVPRQIIKKGDVFLSSRLALGTNVRGVLSTSGMFEGTAGTAASSQIPVILAISIPEGVGSIEAENGSIQPITFEFAPTRNIHPPGGQGELRGLKQSEEGVEATDLFDATIEFPAADVRGGLTGTGTAKVTYNLKIAIDPQTIQVTGQIFMRAQLSAENTVGKHEFDFTGYNLQVETTLDW